MTKEQKEELIKYRIDRAKQTFNEVEIMLQNSLWNTAVNRLYYTCFYAVTSLLIKMDIKAYTHTGIKQMFGLHIILPNIISPDVAKIYNELFDKRHKGDYEDFFYFDEDSVKKLVKPTKELIIQIETLLNK